MGKYSLLLRVRNFPFSSSLTLYLSTAINYLRLHLLEFQDMIKVLDPGHPKIAELKVSHVFAVSCLRGFFLRCKGRRVPINLFSKIQLVVYHQCCVLIG